MKRDSPACIQARCDQNATVDFRVQQFAAGTSSNAATNAYRDQASRQHRRGRRVTVFRMS